MGSTSNRFSARNAEEYQREIRTQRNHTFAVECPCCKRDGVVYWRRLNSGMCRVLIRFTEVVYQHALDKEPDPYLVHIDEVFPRGQQWSRDWPLLRHWGLLFPETHRTPHENAQGLWRLTERGKLFVFRRTQVPSHGAFYENTPQYFSATQTWIDDALGKKFSYSELMEGLRLK